MECLFLEDQAFTSLLCSVLTCPHPAWSLVLLGPACMQSVSEQPSPPCWLRWPGRSSWCSLGTPKPPQALGIPTENSMASWLSLLPLLPPSSPALPILSEPSCSTLNVSLHPQSLVTGIFINQLGDRTLDSQPPSTMVRCCYLQGGLI